MVPKHDPLIETAVRAMSADEEHRQAGAAYLEMLREDRVGGEAEIIGRWDFLDRSKPSSAGKIVLIGLIAALAGWAAVFDFPELYEILRGRSLFSSNEYGYSSESAERRLCAKTSPDQQRLLYGDVTKKDQVSRKEALYLSEPENPAYFAELAMAHLASTKPLPPDFLATARRIDPDNAWFTDLAAAAEVKDCVKIQKRKSRWAGGRRVFLEPVSWDIKDRASLDRALEIFREGRYQNKYEDYMSAMLRRRLAILPQETRRERFDSVGYLENNVQFGVFHTLPVCYAIAARAWLAGQERNEGDLREAVKDADRLLQMSSGMEAGVVVNELAIHGYISQLADSIIPAVDALALNAEADRWREVKARLDAWDASRKSVRFTVDGISVPPELKTGVLGGDELSDLRSWNFNVTLTDADIAPRRYLDHEYLSHLCFYVAFAFLGVVCGIMSLYRYFTRKAIRGLARRMKLQMLPVDWVWMLGMGVVLPFFLVIFLNRLTPLGGRDYGIVGSLLMLPTAQILTLQLLWLILPVWLVHWRLGTRLGIFGFGNWNSWWTGVALACAVLFLFGIRWAALSGTVPGLWVRELDFPRIEIEGRPIAEYPLWGAAGILAVPVFWLFYGVGASLLGSTQRALHRATAARILIPIYASAMVVCMLAIPFYRMAEHYWFRKDALSQFDPAMPSWSRYEYRISQQARGELLKVMGYDTSPHPMGR